MRIKVQTKSLKETTPGEWVQRFCFGGVVTVVAYLISKKWGAVIGGLFLAFPGIFPASASLVEKHKRKREADEGKQGVRSARAEASVEASGASAGALGLAAFALVLWRMLPVYSEALSLLAALGAWVVVSGLCWWLRERM